MNATAAPLQAPASRALARRLIVDSFDRSRCAAKVPLRIDNH